jgi:hypothetical protein
MCKKQAAMGRVSFSLHLLTTPDPVQYNPTIHLYNLDGDNGNTANIAPTLTAKTAGAHRLSL